MVLDLVLGVAATALLPKWTDNWFKTLPEFVGDVVSAHAENIAQLTVISRYYLETDPRKISIL